MHAWRSACGGIISPGAGSGCKAAGTGSAAAARHTLRQPYHAMGFVGFNATQDAVAGWQCVCCQAWGADWLTQCLPPMADACILLHVDACRRGYGATWMVAQCSSSMLTILMGSLNTCWHAAAHGPVSDLHEQMSHHTRANPWSYINHCSGLPQQLLLQAPSLPVRCP